MDFRIRRIDNLKNENTFKVYNKKNKIKTDLISIIIFFLIC